MKDAQLHALAGRQHGLAHQKQLTALGYQRSARENFVASGRWLRRTGPVYQLAGSPDTKEQRLLLAVLDLGLDASLSFETAIARWGVSGFSIHPVHTTGTRERGRSGAHLGIVHQPRLLLPEHVLVLDGIRTTSPTRTLFDLAGVIHPGRLERALDNALASGLTSIPLLHRMLDQLAKKGRPGITLMRELLKARPIGYVPPASNLESRFQHLARKSGWWDFVRQINVGDEHGWLARVDFLDRAERAIAEVQSSRFHRALLDVRADERRHGLLRAAGWRIYEAQEHDVWHRPDKVIRDLHSLRTRRN
jgi:hypothetical protein